MERIVFPFTAVLGQDGIKKTLIWNLINPQIGGVLISGEKGTAKSTLIRGVSALVDDVKIVELPLNITEDRLVGAIDLKTALQQGEKSLDPGILKDADGNILYVDEVNLLSDHIVNALLEVASSGVNKVEREGISCSHDSRFILIGSMNQEEGKLRPQFIDRFGLYAEVKSEKNLHMRTEIMKRRLDFESDPITFISGHVEQLEEIKRKIEAARKSLSDVEVTENAIRLAATLSESANCAGHRGEIVLIETARAITAYDQRKMINIDDIRTAAEYALPHRAREEEHHIPEDCQDEYDEPEEPETEDEPPAPEENEPKEEGRDQEEHENRDDEQDDNHEHEEPPPMEPPEFEPPEEENQTDVNPQDEEDDDIQESGELFLIPRWQEAPVTRYANRGSGRRNIVRSNNKQGRYVGYRMAGDERITDLAFDATVRAAAPFQGVRDKGERAIAIESDDLRVKIREKRTGGCILFVVDASASMGANKRMREVKAAILSLLNVSYQKRDRVGLIAFRKDSAELLLGITRSVDLAQKKLEELPTGGKTPLSKGLDLAYEVIMGLKKREPDAIPTIVLVSDGRASGKNTPTSNPFDDALKSAERIGSQNINIIVLDTENDFIRFHLCEKLNEKLHGTLLTMENLRADGIVEAVSRFR